MNNPFADMQRVREEREQRWEQEREEREKERQAAWLAAERLKAIAFEFDQMVRTPLEQLREAIYPQHQVVGCYERDPLNLQDIEEMHKGSWSIGKKGSYSVGYGSETQDVDCWAEDVRVDLEFDTDDRPTHFKCTRNARYKRQNPTQPLPPPKKSSSGRSNKQPASPQPAEYEDVRYEPLVVELSQEALVRALRQLHPAGSY
jgi:hypothetical protein